MPLFVGASESYDTDAWETYNLKKENAKLRERVDAAHMSRLLTENENESLRELVRDLYEMAYPEFPSAFEAAFADRMQELGIEVDE